METVKAIKKRTIKQRIPLIATCLILMAAIIVFLNPVLESKDDVLIRSIMKGNYTGIPDAHLVYVLYPLGLIFKGLYLIANNAIWFEGFLILMFFGSLFFAADSFENAGPVFFIYILAISLSGATNLQYTQVAGFAAACALVCFRRNKKLPGAILFVLAFWLRKEVCLALLPLLVVLLIVKIVKKEFKKGGIHILVTIAVMAASLLIDMGAYSSNEWKEYKEYNKARTEVYDYNQMPEYERYSDFYESIGISSEEYTALVEYDLAVVDHDTDTFLAMAEKYQSIIKEWNRFSNPFKRTLKAGFLAFMDNLKTTRGFSAALMLFAGFVVSVIECSKKKKVFTENFVQIVFTAVYFVAFIAVFGALNRLPERIVFGTNILAVFSGLDVLFRFFQTEKAKTGICRIILYYVFLTIAMGIFGLLFVGGLVEKHSDKEELYEESFDKIEAANRKIEADSDGIYFLEAALYKSMGGKIGKSKEPANAIKTADWMYNSPLMQKRYERIGITGIFDNASEKKRYIIVPEEHDTEYLEMIFEEHGTEIMIITLDDFVRN